MGSWSGDGTTLSFTERATNISTVSVPFSPFSDTGATIFRDHIIWLAEKGITEGCSAEGLLFCPEQPVTRGQMAALLYQSLEG